MQFLLAEHVQIVKEACQATEINDGLDRNFFGLSWPDERWAEVDMHQFETSRETSSQNGEPQWPMPAIQYKVAICLRFEYDEGLDYAQKDWEPLMIEKSD